MGVDNICRYCGREYNKYTEHTCDVGELYDRVDDLLARVEHIEEVLGIGEEDDDDLG